MADPDLILNTDPDYSVSHVFSTNDITGTFGGLTQGDVLPGETPVIDFTATPITSQEGVALYPINSEFGFIVSDFEAAIQKDFEDNPEYAEGFAGDLIVEGQQAGLVLSDAETDTFKTPAKLGTWLSGLGGNSVKASTEHYVVMQNVLSDQKYPGDPDALYPLDDELVIIGGEFDGQLVTDVLPIVGDVNEDGVVNIIDVLAPNESDPTEAIAVSDDYSVTLKDDGKLLYRWGNMWKKPNDIRIEVEMPLPEEWATEDEGTGLMPLYKVTMAELVTNHTITNNPNDQIRPEDYENEAAIGVLPTYEIITDYNVDGNGPREVWVTTDDYYAGDGTLYPAGTILKDQYLADLAAADPTLSAIGLSSDLAEGFTNAWYTTMDREPFTADYNDAGTDYDIGPRWRLQPDKYGQDLPGVEIPVDPSLPPPPTQDQVKYDVGEDTTTVINLLDWGQNISPLSISAGWQNDSGTVTENGLNKTMNFDVAFYIKGDRKPATLYDTQLLMDYEEITIYDNGDTIVGSLGDDYLVGQGGNTFTGTAEQEDLFVLSYGVSNNWAEIVASVITNFEVGIDTLGLFGFDIDDVNFDDIVEQEVVSGNLEVSLGDVLIATLTGVTEELSMEESFLLLNPGVSDEDRFTGTAGDDYLVGDAEDNVILGLEGNDTIIGLGGSDTLIGGDGDDLVEGGEDGDVLIGGIQNDILYGNDGDDELFGNGGFDQLYGGLGDDTLDGGLQADWLFGEGGNDELIGGGGLDKLSGGAGFDTLTGGEGNDILTGNFNWDIFVFEDGFGTDVITDFEALNVWEKIDLSAVTEIVDFADLMANHANTVGTSVVIDDGLGNSIELQNVAMGDLDASDFIFV